MEDVQPDATSTEVSQAPSASPVPQVEESAPVAAAETQPDAVEQSKPGQGKQSQGNQSGQNRQGQGKGPRPEGQRAQGGGERGPGGERRDNRPPKGQGNGPREGGNVAAREGGRGNDRGGDRGGNRGDRGHDRGGDRRPGGGRPFEAMADIEIEKLISDSLYLDNQAHAVVARMRDMDSGTKSQLRRLFNAVRRAVATPEKERQHEFVMLRARLAYTIARHSLRSLDGLERLLLQVTRKNEARGYERFKDLFEAIVAYNE